MYVRKFEADTIEGALKEIKRELGPDAVILKTITNKGLKGAFKKKKIEITAAISEKNYTRKAQVDTILNDGQKEEFYGGSAGYIANMIDQHDQSKERRPMQSQAGYGSAGLNRAVNSTKGIANQLKEGLDDFLNLGEKEERQPRKKHEFNFDEEIEATKPIAKPLSAEIKKSSGVGEEVFEKQKRKIDELEKKLYELSKNVERIHKKEPIGIYQLRTTLRSLDISESFIQNLIKKGLFELTDIEVENADIVFEFALREMMNNVNTAMPMFSSVETKKSPVITVFLSESSCGQTSMIQKIGAMKKDSIIIKNTNSIIGQSFTEKILGMNVIKTNSIAEIVSECRKALESGKSLFIDYKCNASETNETKKFIDGLRRAFSNVEVLITLSAIHSELYNRKILGSYRRLSDGVVVAHIDACLNFGALFNITHEIKDLPYKFFGTGEVCPDDIEAATAERLMAGIFKLN